MSLQPDRKPRPSISLALGSTSLALGSISALMAAVLIAIGTLEPLGLLKGSGGRLVGDALFGPILLIVWSHGLEPQPSWNQTSAMLVAIAGSPRIYGLPTLALSLGLAGRHLAGRQLVAEPESRLARAALRHSRGGLFLGVVATASLLGLFLIGRLT